MHSSLRPRQGPPARVNMEFPDFYDKFGGSFRTDHLRLSAAQRLRLALAEKGTRDHLARRSRIVADALRKDPAAAFRRFRDRRSRALKASLVPAASSVGGSVDLEANKLLQESTRRPYRLPA